MKALGARNDLPNPYRPGVSWGQLPNGRKWGSTAAEGITADALGNVYGAEFTMDVKKYVRK